MEKVNLYRIARVPVRLTQSIRFEFNRRINLKFAMFMCFCDPNNTYVHCKCFFIEGGRNGNLKKRKRKFF